MARDQQPQLAGLAPTIESMTALDDVGFKNLSTDLVAFILGHLRVGGDCELDLGGVHRMDRTVFERLTQFIKGRPKATTTISFNQCTGSVEDYHRFLRSIQFFPVEMTAFGLGYNQRNHARIEEATKWYNDRIKANREFLISLHNRRSKASDQPMLADLPPEMRHRIYIQTVGPWRTDI
jgi:hypothetical protein